MILDTFHHADRYESVHPLFARGFAYIERFTSDVADGRYELEGDRLFALVQSYTPVPASQKRFEAHRRYIDIQYLHAGEEVIIYAPVESLAAAGPFDDAKDIGFFAEPAVSSPTLLRAGTFAVYFPNDAHKPGCSTGATPSSVRKIVLKVAV